MPPEVFADERGNYTPHFSLDVYSMALIMWEMAVRQKIWDGLQLTAASADIAPTTKEA